MATKVTDLKIALQSGTTTALFASWSFSETITTTSSSIKVGSIVKLNAGAKYYNGVTPSSWVYGKQWIVMSISGDRVVINKSTDGENAIRSPVNVKDLTLVSGGGSSSSTTKTNYLDYYEVKWYYATGDGVWFLGSTSNVEDKNDLYTIPANATKVKVIVKPVSKTYTSNGNTKSYWTGTAVTKEYNTSITPPEQAVAPVVSVDKYKLTAVLDGITDVRADQIEFYVIKGTSKFTSGVSTVKTCRATFSCTISAGAKYRVRCRAINTVDDSNVYGEWSTYSNEVTTIPTAITNLKCSVDSETSVKLTWTGSSTATNYEIEYTSEKKYFDTSSDVNSTSVEGTTAYITGLTTGQEWFFRVRSVNNQGESSWSGIVSKIIGSKPAAPTTWSSTTTAVVGENVTLYWTHNSEDDSKQTAAQIKMIINGTTSTKTITTSMENDEEESIYSYALDLSSYTAGAKILWSVRTKGVTSEYGDWSVQRTIDLYAPPTLELHLGRYVDKWIWDTFNFNTDSVETAYTAEVCEGFPYNVVATAGPTSQTPISYHVSITALESYETENATGSLIRVNAGSEVYSKVIYSSDSPITIELLASDLTLENNQSYKVTVTVAMDTGLTAVASDIFTVIWRDHSYVPNAAISIDQQTLCAYISPFCADADNVLVENVVLYVYRREFDGSFTAIGEELPNDGVITVTDPHPALDFARYRIVARSITTNSIEYEDLPGVPVGQPGIVIQWDEQWSQFNYEEESMLETPPWTGSMLKLPYNVDVTENYNKDVSLIEYIGRKHPVSYYGTQQGVNETWTTDIPKVDKETLYSLRRLAAWDGDVYVRESSGKGYWAQVIISIPQRHNTVVTNITIDVIRVEGGI